MYFSLLAASSKVLMAHFIGYDCMVAYVAACCERCLKQRTLHEFLNHLIHMTLNNLLVKEPLGALHASAGSWDAHRVLMTTGLVSDEQS